RSRRSSSAPTTWSSATGTTAPTTRSPREPPSSRPPAPVTRRIGVDLPTDLREALARIAYGSYVSAAFLTGETAPQSCDRAYEIATPKRSFSVVFNMENVVHAGQPSRFTDGSIIVFSPASLARAILDRTDEEVLRTYLEDLGDVLPGSPGFVEEAHV